MKLADVLPATEEELALLRSKYPADRVRNALFILERCFNDSGNALYAWNALKVAMDSGSDLPAWVASYLYSSAEKLFKRVEEKHRAAGGKNTKPAASYVAEALGLHSSRGQGDIFARFANDIKRATAFTLFRNRSDESMENFAPQVVQWFADGYGWEVSESQVHEWHRQFIKNPK